MTKRYNFTLKCPVYVHGAGTYAYAVVDGKVHTILPLKYGS